MVIQLTILILLVLLPASVAQAAPQPRNLCLGCHASHYLDQGGCVDCHRGNNQTRRKDLAHSGLIAARYANFTNPLSPGVRTGKKLTEQSACRRCHSLAKTGNRLASSLDVLLWSSKPDLIRAAIAKPAIFMPDFHFSELALDQLITAILAGGLQVGKPRKEQPQLVFFSTEATQKQNVFVKQCGGCHKLLSRRDGGLGNGTSAPNLSGLLSSHYPASFEAEKKWNAERLKRWLKNPRAIRPQTLMRPIPLKPNEWQELLRIVTVD